MKDENDLSFTSCFLKLPFPRNTFLMHRRMYYIDLRLQVHY